MFLPKLLSHHVALARDLINHLTLHSKIPGPCGQKKPDAR